MFMTPGLALFYGGMVRAKNVLGHADAELLLPRAGQRALGRVHVLARVPRHRQVDRQLRPRVSRPTRNVIPATGFGQVPIPPLSFSAFQLMFAVITPALITGAIADRMKFSAWFWFLGLWALVVYTPVAHWVFSPAGWLFRRGALDFAGGTVVHINAGIAALAAVLVLGRRRGWPEHPIAAALAAAHAARHRHPVVRLVRVQRRIRARGQRHRRAGVHQHHTWPPPPPCSAGCCSNAPRRARDDAGRGVGRGRRARRDHAVRRVRRRHGARSASG